MEDIDSQRMWITKRLISISIDVGIQNDCIDVREERRRKSGKRNTFYNALSNAGPGASRRLFRCRWLFRCR
jgi:hypothetical protein